MPGQTGPIGALTDGKRSFHGVRFTTGHLHADRLVKAPKPIADTPRAKRKSASSPGKESK